MTMPGRPGTGGRTPVPTKTLKLRGSKRAKYNRSDDEPKPKLGVPKMPKWLNKEARAEWRRVAPELTRMGVLAEIERGALGGYCKAWSDLQDRTAMVAETGWTLRRANGDIVANPVVKQMNEAMLTMLRFAQDLGLTPASRTRVHAKPVEEPETGVGRFVGEAG